MGDLPREWSKFPLARPITVAILISDFRLLFSPFYSVAERYRLPEAAQRVNPAAFINLLSPPALRPPPSASPHCLKRWSRPRGTRPLQKEKGCTVSCAAF